MIKMAAFAGFCPVNVSDFITLLDGRSGIIYGIRTIHEITQEDMSTNFEVQIVGNNYCTPVSQIASTTWEDKSGARLTRCFK